MNKKIRSQIVKWVPFRLRKALFKLKLYVRAPKLLLLANVPFNTSHTTLLLSFPRSGSSWIGAMLGTGENIRYLREPVTTHYTLTKSPHKSKKRISVFDQDTCDNWPEYCQYLNDSLAAKPKFSNSVIPFPQQWRSSKQQKPLLIKEVNPLIINYYLTKQLNIVYLVRHPFSVAKSYKALNWGTADLFANKFKGQTLHLIKKFMPTIQLQNNWVQMGYLQGWIEASVKQQLTNSHLKVGDLLNSNTTEPASIAPDNKVMVIRYEDICQAPQQKFNNLFDFTGIEFSTQALTRINQSLSYKQKVNAGDFSLNRNKEALQQIKIKPEDHQAYLQLMQAYLQAFEDCQQSNAQNGLSNQHIMASYTLDEPFIDLAAH